MKKSPLVTAALRRAAQAKAGRESAKDEAAVKLHIEGKPKDATELEPRGLPNRGFPDAPVCPHQVGVAEVVPGQAQNLPGPCTSVPRVQPPQMGLADDLRP